MQFRIDWTATYTTSPDVTAPLPTLFTYDPVTALFSDGIGIDWPIGSELVVFGIQPNSATEFGRRVLFRLLEGGGNFMAANAAVVHDAVLELTFNLPPLPGEGSGPVRIISHNGSALRNEGVEGTWTVTPVAVTEPSTLSLASVGLFMLLGLKFLSNHF